MTRTVCFALIATTAIAVAGGTALARGDGHRTPVDFETLDGNGDGQITQDEMQARGSERFARADADGDGFLSLQEVETATAARSAERAARMFERMDTNSDGRLSAEELQRPEGAERRFSRLDRDGNGAISEAELNAARANLRGQRKPGGRSE